MEYTFNLVTDIVNELYKLDDNSLPAIKRLVEFMRIKNVSEEDNKKRPITAKNLLSIIGRLTHFDVCITVDNILTLFLDLKRSLGRAQYSRLFGLSDEEVGKKLSINCQMKIVDKLINLDNQEQNHSTFLDLLCFNLLYEANNVVALGSFELIKGQKYFLGKTKENKFVLVNQSDINLYDKLIKI